MKITLLSLLLLASVSIEAQNLPQTFNLADAPRYSEKTGYGYDRVDTPKKTVMNLFISPCVFLTEIIVSLYA